MSGKVLVRITKVMHIDYVMTGHVHIDFIGDVKAELQELVLKYLETKWIKLNNNEFSVSVLSDELDLGKFKDEVKETVIEAIKWAKNTVDKEDIFVIDVDNV